MSSRLCNLLSHIVIRDEDSCELRYVKQRLALATLATQFTLSTDRLKQLTMYMVHEMMEGLQGRDSTLKMLPSFVYGTDPSRASGAFYALDLGGTNFRVLRVAIAGGKVVSCQDAKFVIPKEAVGGTAEDLFGFIARSVKTMMMEKAPDDLDCTVPLGFTFSFPTNQKDINRGELIMWTKGFCTSGVEGHDVVELLQKALQREKVKVTVEALCNDTVGTMVARYFEDQNCQVGVILGTGSNACYFDRAAAMTKLPNVAARGDAITAVNVECGNFDSKGCYVLPITSFDEDMDNLTTNKGSQRLEKIVSGMYLGEVARHIIVRMAKMGCLPSTLAENLSKPWCFETKYMGMITADHMPGLQFTRRLIKQHAGVDVADIADLFVIREICCYVRNRAAQMGAMFSSAPILKTNNQGRATIAVDGSVYEKTPSFQRLYQREIDAILGPESNVKVVMQKDGSGIGAALICALVASGK